jgi:biotin synthase
VNESTRTETELLLDATIGDRQIQHLLDRADTRSRELSGERGYVWAAIGIDSAPCPMGCSFCSHAARWDVYSGETRLSEEEIVDQAGTLADGGADFVVLRTTQFYPTETLVTLGQRVRNRIGDEIHLVVNTGESAPDRVKALRDGGFNMAYHVVRLREGVDTGHSVEMRLRTIDAIRTAGMELQYLIEPLGPEHTAEEILTEARRARSVGASGTGVMARVPVMGTPLAHLGQVSEPYLRRVAAAARLEYPDGGKYLCVHPPTPSAFRTGCNTVVVEQAANPRDTILSASAWRRFDLDAARTALREAGFQVRKRKSV